MVQAREWKHSALHTRRRTGVRARIPGGLVGVKNGEGGREDAVLTWMTWSSPLMLILSTWATRKKSVEVWVGGKG